MKKRKYAKRKDKIINVAAPSKKLEDVIEAFVEACRSAEIEHARAVAALKQAKEATDKALATLTAAAAASLIAQGAKIPKVPAAAPPAGETKRDARGHVKNACSSCGSYGRHRKTCEIHPWGGGDGKLPDDDDDDAPPALKSGKAKRYRCLDDEGEFASTLPFDEVRCPKNDRHAITQL